MLMTGPNRRGGQTVGDRDVGFREPVHAGFADRLCKRCNKRAVAYDVAERGQTVFIVIDQRTAKLATLRYVNAFDWRGIGGKTER